MIVIIIIMILTKKCFPFYVLLLYSNIIIKKLKMYLTLINLQDLPRAPNKTPH